MNANLQAMHPVLMSRDVPPRFSSIALSDFLCCSKTHRRRLNMPAWRVTTSSCISNRQGRSKPPVQGCHQLENLCVSKTKLPRTLRTTKTLAYSSHLLQCRAMSAFTLPGFGLEAFITSTLAEDLGVGLPGGGRDVTSESVIPAEARFAGVMDSREAIIVAGLPLAAAFFRHLDPGCEIETLCEDGDLVTPGTALMRITGNARALLTIRRFFGYQKTCALKFTRAASVPQSMTDTAHAQR